MNGELHELFPIPVVRYTDVLTDQQLKDIFNYIIERKDEFGEHGAFTENAVSSFLDGTTSILNILQENIPSCSNIQNTIYDAVRNYTEIVGANSNNIFFSNSWVNIQQKGSILKMHHHSDAFLSGALYIHTDLDSSKLIFEDFFNHKLTMNPGVINEENRFNIHHYWFKPNIGDLIIFPGQLKHGSYYEQNQTDNRMVVSFNIQKIRK